MSTVTIAELFEPRHPIKRGEPTWDIALLFPAQGDWTEEEYLTLDNNSENRLLELVDGCLEVLPMPDIYHQRIVRFLLDQASDFVRRRAEGEVLFAPLPVRLLERQFREPDILYLRPERIADRHKPPHGADLVVEVVSPGEENRERDLEIKRVEYAKAKIAEYWIVDPQQRTITVLVLTRGKYRVHGRFGPGQQATSVLLRGFAVDVAAVFAAGAGPNPTQHPSGK